MARQEAAPANEVQLTGRVSGDPSERTLPSGDRLVQFRVVVLRPARRSRTRPADAEEPGQGTSPPDRPRTQVDTIDVACWSARTRASALRLQDGAGVRVEGSVRRRFFSAGAGRASRYEVEARSLRQVRLTG